MKKTETESSRYRNLPREFLEFSRESGVGQAGTGYIRRVATANLLGIPQENLRTWSRQGDEPRATSLNIAKIKALLWVLGYIGDPVTHVESFEITVGIGVTKLDEVNGAIGYGPGCQPMLPKIMSGAPMLAAKVQKMAEHVEKKSEAVSLEKARWLKELRAVGIEPKSKPADAGAAEKAAPAPEIVVDPPEEALLEGDATTVAASAAALINGLVPLLVTLDGKGSSADFRYLRHKTKLPDGGNGVFALKNLLAGMTSDEARRVIKDGGKTKNKKEAQ